VVSYSDCNFDQAEDREAAAQRKEATFSSPSLSRPGRGLSQRSLWGSLRSQT